MLTTFLIKQHQQAGAKLVDFHGWQMPLHYGSQLKEHHAVRQDAGVFDVSHMAIIEVSGNQAFDYLSFLLANNVAKLTNPGKALYTCMINPEGGIIDDLIVYKIHENFYKLVVNSGTREKDWQWLQAQKNDFSVNLTLREDLGILAIQGPQAIAKLLSLLQPEEQSLLQQLAPFQGCFIGDFFYSRTGYTGEDGVEIQIPAEKIVSFWERLLSVGITPCGLGARDTLRLEAGLNLYGTDMDENTSPLESNLSWTVDLTTDRDFIGRKALERQQSHAHQQLIGVVMEEAGVLRRHQEIILPNQTVGEITSGTFSPTLGHSIALARIPGDIDTTCGKVTIRQKSFSVHFVKPPFVRKGKKVYQWLDNKAPC